MNDKIVLNEKFRLYQSSGVVIEGISAAFMQQSSLMTVLIYRDPSLHIVKYDIIERSLPNNKTEWFKVLTIDGDHCICGARSMLYFETHREELKNLSWINVERLSSVPRCAASVASGDTYNIQNDGGRVNIHSTDNTVNITLSVKDEQLFHTLIELANSLPNKDEVNKAIRDMKLEVGKPSFAARYKEFIQSVANHMTIFAPFIPALTAFLTR